MTTARAAGPGRRRSRIALWFLLVVAIAQLGLWLAGAPPLRSGAYVQAVTATSAVLAKVGAAPRRLRARVWSEMGGDVIEVEETGPSREHALRVDGLKAGRHYHYLLMDRAEEVARGSFHTAPVADDSVVRFAAVGDSGQLPWWFNMHRFGWSRLRPLLAWTQRPPQWDLAEWIAAQDPHFFVHLGDLVYWRQVRAAMGEGFFAPFAPVLERAALCAVAGNHDLPRDGSQPPFEHLFHHVARDAAPSVGRPQRNYTSVWGGVRVIVFDVLKGEGRTGSPARAWLERTLATAGEPWLVVVSHAPCFSVYREEEPWLRDELWALFERHGVDLVLSGDDHHFARFHPPAPGGPIQYVVGGGGKDLYDIDTSDPRLAASAKAWSFLLVEVEGLRMECRAMGSATEVIDRLVIDRRVGPLPEGMTAGRRASIEALRQ